MGVKLELLTVPSRKVHEIVILNQVSRTNVKTNKLSSYPVNVSSFNIWVLEHLKF